MAEEHSIYASSLLDYETNKGNSKIDWVQLVMGEGLRKYDSPVIS